MEGNGIADILCESEWYKMPIKIQNDIVKLIHRKQNCVKLTVGPFGTVNRDLFKVVRVKCHRKNTKWYQLISFSVFLGHQQGLQLRYVPIQFQCVNTFASIMIISQFD